MAEAFFGGDVPAETLAALTLDAVSFDAPLVPVAERRHVLELFHGPTLAFKDFGARFMARLMAWLLGAFVILLFLITIAKIGLNK